MSFSGDPGRAGDYRRTAPNLGLLHSHNCTVQSPPIKIMEIPRKYSLTLKPQVRSLVFRMKRSSDSPEQPSKASRRLIRPP